MLDEQTLRTCFADPPATYRPQPFWFINHEPDREELIRQLQMMHEKGVGGVVFHPRHGLPVRFLGPEWLAALEAVCAEADRLGMHVWLYDEDNWPSGTDGGRLTSEHPEYRMRYLRYWEQRIEGPQEVTLSPELDDNEIYQVLLTPLEGAEGQPQMHRAQEITGRFDATRGTLKLHVPAGPHVVSFFFICPVPQGVTFRNGSYMDTLDQDACEEFVRRCYEPNLLACSEQMGETVQGIFTDEPGLMIHDGFFGTRAFRPTLDDPRGRLPGYVLPWSRRFAEMFEAWRGYDLRRHLLALVYETSADDLRVRQDYYRTATEAYVRHYYGTIRRFTDRNDLKLIGHTLEEPIWAQARSQGNQHQVLAQFSLPGYDYLAMQAGIATAENPARLLAAQCAYSVAALKGGERVVVEAFGGSGNGATLAQRRRHANLMAMLGTSLFMPHGFYQSFAGERKSDWPPSEFYQAPFWEQYDAFSAYLGRISLIADSGKPLDPVLVLSPIHTAYRQIASDGVVHERIAVDEVFSALSYHLLGNGRSHLYIDEDHLVEGQLDGGTLSFNAYINALRVLIVPGATVLCDETVPFLARFLATGGRILWIGQIPTVTTSGAAIQQEALQGPGSSVLPSYDPDEVTRLLDEWLPRTIQLDDYAPAEVFSQVKVLGDHRLIMAYNPSEFECVQPRLRLTEGSWDLEELDPETGECRIRAAGVTEMPVDLEPSQLRVLLASPAAPNTTVPAPAPAGEWRSLTARRLERAQDNLLPLDQWALSLSVPFEERRGLARWMAHTTVIRYRTTFGVQDLPERLMLVLDDLRPYIPAHYGALTGYRAYEITVNGQVVPPATPYEYPDHYLHAVEITSYLRKGENEIALYVAQSNEKPAAPTLQYPMMLVGPFALNTQSELIADNPARVGYWDETGAPYYSGVGRYTFHLDLDEPAEELTLDLGEVHESARIEVNGEPCATRAWPPYVVRVPGPWREGVNTVVVEVANTARNTWEKRAERSGMEGTLRYRR